MKRLSTTETAVVQHYNITPENISEKMNELNYAEIATWCMHNGFTQAFDKISVACMLENIHNKFWDNDGFDCMSIEDVAGWVLTTYLTEDRVMVMSGEEIISYLQNWKYYYGFRKHEGDGELYRYIALDIWSGNLIQDPDDIDICYVTAPETN